MDKYNTTKTHFAKIAEKNHRHSALNPYSQFRDIYTLDQIMASPEVYAPLTKLQCCPTSDGAAAAIIVSEDFVHRHKLEHQAVEIVAMAMATDMPSTFKDSCIKVASRGTSALPLLLLLLLLVCLVATHLIVLICFIARF
jgi:sterol carrier protein 2